MTNMKKQLPDRKVSITFQTLAPLREQLIKLAKEMGYTRMKDGQDDGELSPLLVLACEFLVAHMTVFRKWVSEGKKTSAKV